jgi:hypothetical protein
MIRTGRVDILYKPDSYCPLSKLTGRNSGTPIAINMEDAMPLLPSPVYNGVLDTGFAGGQLPRTGREPRFHDGLHGKA